MYNETYVFSFEPIELNVDISDSHIYCGRSFHYPDPRFDGPVHEREIKHPFERWFPEFQNIFPQHIRAPWLKYFNLYPVSHFEDPSEYHLQLSAQRRCAALIRNHVQNKGPIWQLVQPIPRIHGVNDEWETIRIDVNDIPFEKDCTERFKYKKMVIYKFECSGPNNTTVEKNIQHHYEKGNNICLYLDPLHGSRTPYVFSYEPIAMDVPISDPKLYGGREFIYPDWRFDGYEVGFEKNVYRPFEKYFPDKVNNFPPFCVSPTGIFVELRSMDQLPNPVEYHFQRSAMKRCAAFIRDHVLKKGPIWQLFQSFCLTGRTSAWRVEYIDVMDIPFERECVDSFEFEANKIYVFVHET